MTARAVRAKRLVALVGVAALAASAAVATVLFARSSDQRGRPFVQAHVEPSSPSALARVKHGRNVRGRNLSLPPGVTLPPVIVPSSVTPHGSFTSLRGERHYIFEGSLRSDELHPTFDRDPVPPRCVVEVGPRYSGIACGHPFANSDLFFLEGTEGGPTAGTETVHLISGLCSPRVARIEAVDSSGAIEQGQVNGAGAFFVELPATALAKGLRFEALRAYDRNGALIEQADA
jgi:hypothetical protein